MASINCYQYMKTVMSRMMPGENATNSQQGQAHPGVVSSKSRIQCTEEARKEALIRQQQTQYTADRRRTRAVLERMGISTPEDLIPSPHPIPAHRPSCLPSVKLRPLSKPPCNADVATNSQTPSTQKQQKHLKNKKAGNVPLDRQFSQTCLTPCTPPLPPPPPSSAVTPEPMNGPSGADKKVPGRYRCPTATMEKIQRRLETIERDLAVSSIHRPLATPRGKPATAPVTPACPPEPAPLKKKRSNRRRTIKPVNIVNTGQRTIYHELAEEFQHFLQTTLREKEEKKRLAEEEDRIHQLSNMDYTTACHFTTSQPFTPAPPPEPVPRNGRTCQGVTLKPANAVNTGQETIHLELEEEFGRVLKSKMAAKEIQTYWLPTDYTAKIFCRPTAYIPEHSPLPLPKPYGAMAPFMPDPPGCQMRHYRKPKVKPIVI